MSANLEHIFFAGKVLIKLFNLLKADGYFYIRTPYIMPIYNFLLRFKYEMNILFPEHVHDFQKAFYENVPKTFDLNNIKIIVLQPAFFEASLKKHFLKALVSRIIRIPYYLNKNYPFCGSWEVIYKKIDKDIDNYIVN